MIIIYNNQDQSNFHKAFNHSIDGENIYIFVCVIMVYIIVYLKHIFKYLYYTQSPRLLVEIHLHKYNPQ